MKFSEQTEKGVSAIRPILEREIWVDNVKVIACVLVVLGHFFQSMVKASIISDNSLYQWFIQTIYYFHVPLFFICSGYLYRRGSKSHWANVLNKLIVLGVPYFTFSFATWALKTTFSGQVNTEIGGLRDVLFFHPTSPYWFLYTLFFVFLITPRFKNFKIYIVVFFASVIAKLAAPKLGIDIYAVNSVLENEVWFVGGMLLNMCDPITKLQTNAKKVTGGGVHTISTVYSLKHRCVQI